MKVSKPNNIDEVYDVMKDYCSKKNFSLSDSKIKYMAEDAFLLHESRGWAGSKYWPAVIMRYVLNYVSKWGTVTPTTKQQKSKGKTARDRILESLDDEF